MHRHDSLDKAFRREAARSNRSSSRQQGGRKCLNKGNSINRDPEGRHAQLVGGRVVRGQAGELSHVPENHTKCGLYPVGMRSQ